MSYPAKVIRQLGHDGPWAGYDCWIATSRGLVAFASGGKVHIDPETARKRAGKWADNPTQHDLDTLGPGNLSDIAAILRHPDTVADFAAAGLKPPKVRNLGAARVVQVCTYLTLGYQAAIDISYGVVNSLRPRISGDPNFNGGHSVRVYGAFDVNGKPLTTVAQPFLTDQLDPLDDGRRAGIALGPQRINRKFMALETAPLASQRHVLALVVKAAEPITVTPPPPPDCCDEVARLQGVIRAIGAALTDAQAPLNAIAGIVTDPANTGGADQ